MQKAALSVKSESRKPDKKLVPITKGLHDLQTLHTKLIRAARLVIIQQRTQRPLDDEVKLILQSCGTLKHLNVVVEDVNELLHQQHAVEDNSVNTSNHSDRQDQVESLNPDDNVLANKHQYDPVALLESSSECNLNGVAQVHPDNNQMQVVTAIDKNGPQAEAITPTNRNGRRHSRASSIIQRADGQYANPNASSQVKHVHTLKESRDELLINAEFYANRPGDPIQIAKRIAAANSETSHLLLKRILANIREEEALIKTHMETLGTDDEKNIFLIQQFLINCVSGTPQP